MKLITFSILLLSVGCGFGSDNPTIKADIKRSREFDRINEEIAKEGNKLALLQQKRQTFVNGEIKVCEAQKLALMRDPNTLLLSCLQPPPAAKAPVATPPAVAAPPDKKK